ncbi:MAG: alpha/beta fold hydrolase [Actinobacteria bacterium]|nr:alpha/beta fold hydrolase [Actinomycetota bacterium]
MPNIGPPLPPGRRLQLPGRGQTFIREITGPPGAPTLFLLHGLSATADLNWFTCYHALGREFGVVAIDHRGHGHGIRSVRRFRLEDCADDVAAVCHELGLERIIPVGYSMGGPIAQLTWRRHRELVAGLVLCATARTFAEQSPRNRVLMSGLLGMSAAARMAPVALRDQFFKTFVGRRLPDTPMTRWAASELGHNDAATVLQATWAVSSYDSRRWIGEVDVPTAVVMTTHDRLVAPDRQRKLAESIPGATVYPVRADHGAVAMAANAFVPALLEACEDVASRAGIGVPAR